MRSVSRCVALRRLVLSFPDLSLVLSGPGMPMSAWKRKLRCLRRGDDGPEVELYGVVWSCAGVDDPSLSAMSSLEGPPRPRSLPPSSRFPVLR